MGHYKILVTSPRPLPSCILRNSETELERVAESYEDALRICYILKTDYGCGGDCVATIFFPEPYFGSHSFISTLGAFANDWNFLLARKFRCNSGVRYGK